MSHSVQTKGNKEGTFILLQPSDNAKERPLATGHKDGAIAILSAERSGGGIIIDFSDGTTTFFLTRVLYEGRNDDGNVALTNMSDEELMNGF